MLGFYGVESGMEIHIVDTVSTEMCYHMCHHARNYMCVFHDNNVLMQDPFSISRGGGLEDVSLVQKYTMTEEEYENRPGTLRDWIRKKVSPLLVLHSPELDA
jgi:tubulin-folding cofactor B